MSVLRFLSILIFVSLSVIIEAEVKNELVLLGDDKIGSVLKTTPPKYSSSELPVSLDYRSLGLLTTDLNQHIPVYCGSCWY